MIKQCHEKIKFFALVLGIYFFTCFGVLLFGFIYARTFEMMGAPYNFSQRECKYPAVS